MAIISSSGKNGPRRPKRQWSAAAPAFETGNERKRKEIDAEMKERGVKPYASTREFRRKQGIARRVALRPGNKDLDF